MKSIGIVICNYNKSEYVVNCIQSVLASDTDDFDVYVVDNASQDDSVLRVRECFGDKVTLLVNEENLGGSGGFNRGLRTVLERGYPYALCLDNDVTVDPSAIRLLREFLDTHPDVGMVGSKVCHMEQPDVIQQFGLDIDWDHFCTEAKYFGRHVEEDLPEVVYCYAVAACSLMVRRSVMQSIGLMPEENFLYWDDTEWGYQCNLAGSRVAAYGRSRVWHAMGAKKEAVNTFPTYYAWRNWLRFFVRYTPAEFREVMARAFIGEMFENVYTGLYRKEENRFRTILLAYEDALHGVTGKAPEGRIFTIDDAAFRQRLTDLIKRHQQIFIIAEEYVAEALSLAEELDALAEDRCIELFEKEDELFTAEHAMREEQTKTDKLEREIEAPLYIKVCESIFHLPETEIKKLALECDSLGLEQSVPKKIYMDLEGNFIETREDVKLVSSYQSARETFLRAYVPVFLDLAGRFGGE